MLSCFKALKHLNEDVNLPYYLTLTTKIAMTKNYSPPTKEDVSKFLQKIEKRIKNSKKWPEQKHGPRL